MTREQKFRRVLRWLRKEHPPHLPVRLRQVDRPDMAKCDGHTWLDKDAGVFRIEINRRRWYGTRLDTLIHEWAHALTWFGAETEIEDHGAEWGIAYARLYRTLHKWYYPKDGTTEADEVEGE